MKKILSYLSIICAITLLGTGCGSDTPDVLEPTVEESSITCNVSTRTIYFTAVFPEVDLISGSTYAYYVIAYNSNGEETFRSKEHTFTLPKNPGPPIPVVKDIIAHAPTSLVASDGYIEGDVISQEMEYSIDDGKEWKMVTEPGIIRQLPSGKVLLRIAETQTTEASKTASVIVPIYKSNTDLTGEKGTSDGTKVKKL